MAREFLEDILSQVRIGDIERVHLPTARALFADISRNTEHPLGLIDSKTGQVRRGSNDPKMLSKSIKFDKSMKSPDPVVSQVVQRGMYLAPAGKYGCADACKDKTASCKAACLNPSGHMAYQLANQIARTNMLTRHPAEGLALIADEAHTFFEKTLKEGYLPSLRLDGTSELHIDEMDVGDYIFQGPKGKYAKIRKGSEFGPTEGLPMAVGSEYGKRDAKDVLPGNERERRQTNVTRVHSWSDRMTEGRARQLQSRGLDIALPVTNFGSSQHPKPVSSHVEVQFGPGGHLVMPTADYDEHDAVGVRNQTGSAGLLRNKLPGFGLEFDPGDADKVSRFLREHPAVDAQGQRITDVSGPKRRKK